VINNPVGTKPTNAFGALRDLLNGWKQDGFRYAAVMISTELT
jgi:hypothetical protein